MGDFFAFRRMITPVLIQISFWVGLAVVVISGLGALVGGGVGVFGGLAILVFGPLYLRLIAELMIIVFRINETLTDIRTNTARTD